MSAQCVECQVEQVQNKTSMSNEAIDHNTASAREVVWHEQNTPLFSLVPTPRDALAEAFARDGAVLVRGAVPRATVRRARAEIEKHAQVGSLLAQPALAARPAVRAALEHRELRRIAQILLGAPVRALAAKWLRRVPSPLFTGVHVDRRFVGAATERLATAWLVLDETIAPLNGALAVVLRSHAESAVAARAAAYTLGEFASASLPQNEYW